MGRPLPIPTFLADQSRFLLRLARSPRSMGAIAPSSRALARAMAAQIPVSEGEVLELGPGTGIVTEAILARAVAPHRLMLIECDPEFAALAKVRFPEVRVVCGDAFELAKMLKPPTPFAAIVSSLPLLNFPAGRRAALLECALELLAPGAPFVQFSYGMNPPVAPPKGASVTQRAFVILNMPPARVWVYRMTGIGDQK